MEENAKQQAREDEIASMVVTFCKEKLNGEYELLCEKMVRRLGQKCSKELATGRQETWAAAVVYTICSMNYVFAESHDPYIPSKEICAYFGTSGSTVKKKSRALRDMLHVSRFWDREFQTQSTRERNVFFHWMKNPFWWLRLR